MSARLRWAARAGAAGFAAAALVLPAGMAGAAVLAPGGGTAAAARMAVFGQSVDVTTLADSGPGSLRDAITAANAAPPGTGTAIRFTMAGTITLASGLPAIVRPVSVDATSAPGFVSGGPPVVALDCGGHPGLRFAPGADGSQLLALAVDGASGNGVSLDASSVTLDGDYIGLDLAGQPAGNAGAGVFVSSASAGDHIGRNLTGDSGATSNVISANGGSGIVLFGAVGTTVADNRIGTDPTGGVGIGNGGDGILLTNGSDGNEIGGTDFVDAATGQVNNPTGSKGTVPPVFVVPPLGNQISANARNGVAINGSSQGNSLNGNFIGTTADGDAALGNAGDGVWISRSDGNSLTGCKFVNNPFVYYNVVSGNGQNGLRVTDAGNTVVQGNFFGPGANNTALLPNRRDGVLVEGSSSQTQVGGVIPLGNVAAGNGANGIEVTGTASEFTTFNTFGGLLAFKGAAPNGNDGLLITSSGAGNLVRTNVFSGNARNGIELAGHATGVTVDPNIAGLTTNGRAALPNGGDGLLIRGHAHGNVIGGSLRSVIPQNTFSANGRYGIAIVGRAHGNRVFASFVGLQILGVHALGNGRGGILIGGRAFGNVVGRFRTRPANLVSGNAGNGITLRAGTFANLVINNFIGLNRFVHRLRNTGRPVANSGHGNVVRHNRTRPRA
jgi:hypothetical protein